MTIALSTFKRYASDSPAIISDSDKEMSLSAQQLEKSIQTILSLSDQQLQCAEDGDWEQLEKLGKEKQKLINSSLKAVVSPNLGEELSNIVRAGIGKIKDAEDRLLNLAEKAKVDSVQQLQKLKQGGKAAKAYKQFT